MKVVNRMLVSALAAGLLLSLSVAVPAQQPEPAESQTRPRVASTASPTPPVTQEKSKESKPASLPTGERLEPDDAKQSPADVPAEMQANRQEQMSEESDVVPYYNNFFTTYRLGPEDVISVNVFGQDRYSRSGIIIPPSGRISLALIPGGIFVNGKTVDRSSRTHQETV